MMQQAVNSSVVQCIGEESAYLESPRKRETRNMSRKVVPEGVVEKNIEDISNMDLEEMFLETPNKGGSEKKGSPTIKTVEEEQEEATSVLAEGDDEHPPIVQQIIKQLSQKSLSKEDITKAATVITKHMSSTKSPNNGSFLLNPNSKFRNRWDVIVIFALIFVALVTPFEVAFLEFEDDSPAQITETGISALTVLNRIIDVVFAIDIILNFVTPYKTIHGNWVTNHRLIALRYMKSWLLIDLVSVMPFEMLRMIRLLRLAKLLRIFRASRVLKRWETRMTISYGYITLTRFIVYMLLLSHWLACLFRMVPEFETDKETNWLETYLLGLSDSRPIGEVPPGEAYNIALYWAVMTVTTIGYGDVLPVTDTERWIVLIAMMVGGAAYAYIVGSVCGLVASMGELTARLHRKIDDLNKYMEDNKFPTKLRIRLREYFHYTAKQGREQHYQWLLEEMSPEMRGEVCRLVNESWVLKLPFINCTSQFERKAFITCLSEKLKKCIFPPQERIAKPGQMANEMFIIERGVVMINRSYFVPPELQDGGGEVLIDMKNTLANLEKEILTRGKTFGEDMIMTNARRRYSCMTFTYVELYVLTKDDLNDVFGQEIFPETLREFRKYVIKMAFRKKFVHCAKLFQARERTLQKLGKEKELEDFRSTLRENMMDTLSNKQLNNSQYVTSEGKELSTPKHGDTTRFTFDNTTDQDAISALQQDIALIKKLLVAKSTR